MKDAPLKPNRFTRRCPGCRSMDLFVRSHTNWAADAYCRHCDHFWSFEIARTGQVRATGRPS